VKVALDHTCDSTFTCCAAELHKSLMLYDAMQKQSVHMVRPSAQHCGKVTHHDIASERVVPLLVIDCVCVGPGTPADVASSCAEDSLMRGDNC
jgi:hypothetical protein